MKNKSTPGIRFAEFTGDWEQRKLGELCDEFKSGKNIKSEDIRDEGRYPVFGGNGLRGYTNTYNRDGLYALIGRQGALCGNMNLSYGKAYFTEHAIAVKGNKNNETRFLFYLLGNMNLGQYSGQSAQPGLAVNKLIELSAFIPTFAEQAQISALFKKLDILITLYQQELTILKQTKQGFLQKIFSQEIRFKDDGGEDFPNWEETDLSKLLSIPEKEIENNVSKNKLLTVKLHRNGVQVNQNTDTLKIGSTNYYRRKSGQFIYGKQNFFNGAFDIIPDKYDGYLSSGDVPTLDINENKVLPLYLLYYMGREGFYKRAESVASGTGSKRIHESTLLGINISLPTMKEQTKIGNFFKQLDDTIALHQRELDALMETKKAFLQKMFV